MSTRELKFFDGTKSIPINALPEEAWTTISGGEPGKDQKMVNEVGWLKRCIIVRAEALSSMPWSVTDKAGTELWTSSNDDPPDDLQWLDNFEDLLKLTEYSLILNSAAYWSVEQSYFPTFLPDGTMRFNPSSIEWMAASTMKPIWDPNYGLIQFERRINKELIYMAPEEVVYIRIPDPNHETRDDVPLIQAARASANVLQNVDEFTSQFFKRGAVKATILTVDKSAPKLERDRLKEWWRRVLSGISSAWRTEVISSAVVPVIIGDGLAELSNKDLTIERRQDIATTLGVPHSLVFSNSANFATADVDRRNFYINTVIPSSRLIAKQINRQLLKPRNLRIKFKPESLSLFQVDEQDRSISFVNYINGGMKPSVAAQILGITLPANYKYEELDSDYNNIQGVQGNGPGSAENGLNKKPQEEPIKRNNKRSYEEDEEARKFKKWAKTKLKSGNAEARDFESSILTLEDKVALLIEVTDGN